MSGKNFNISLFQFSSNVLGTIIKLHVLSNKEAERYASIWMVFPNPMSSHRQPPKLFLYKYKSHFTPIF